MNISTLTYLSALYGVDFNHEFVQKDMLSREISISIYQGRCVKIKYIRAGTLAKYMDLEEHYEKH